MSKSPKTEMLTSNLDVASSVNIIVEEFFKKWELGYSRSVLQNFETKVKQNLVDHNGNLNEELRVLLADLEMLVSAMYNLSKI